LLKGGTGRRYPTPTMARILLIDDDDNVRTILSQNLVHAGHTVIEAHNGKEGLDLFQAAKVDLVITDILMPEKAGFEVLVKLREKHRSMKVIAITGGGIHDTASYLVMAKLIGASRVLEKPFSIETLFAAIDELLPTG
jgi:DNA-binding response OmpR family regulator